MRFWLKIPIFANKFNTSNNMALNIKSTPILLGKDAKRFIDIVKANRKKPKINPIEKKRLLEMAKSILQKAQI